MDNPDRVVRTFATCICGEEGQIPPASEWKDERDDSCDDPQCGFLDKCDDCQFRNFLTRYCSCDCDNCTIVSFCEVEIDKGVGGADFGLTGVNRLPKEERWNPALGEYCLTTGDVEKYRKQQGKEYVKGDPPKPYRTSDEDKAKEKRREFAEKAVSVEVKEDE